MTPEYCLVKLEGTSSASADVGDDQKREEPRLPRRATSRSLELLRRVLRCSADAPPQNDRVTAGGGGEIRTPGTLRYGGFQNRCLRPLGHSSKSWSRGRARGPKGVSHHTDPCVVWLPFELGPLLYYDAPFESLVVSSAERAASLRGVQGWRGGLPREAVESRVEAP